MMDAVTELLSFAVIRSIPLVAPIYATIKSQLSRWSTLYNHLLCSSAGTSRGGSNKTCTTMKPQECLTASESCVLGFLDTLLGMCFQLSGPLKPKYFVDGFGNDWEEFHEKPARWHSTIPAHFRDMCDTHLLFHQIEWLSDTADDGIVIKEAETLSPMADDLPLESKRCRFHVVEPFVQDGDAEPIYIIMLGSTGEMGKGIRLAQAKELARRHGWCSVIHNTAYYGIRRPANQTLFYNRAAIDFVKMVESTTQESVALAHWILDKYCPAAKICLTGFSMGGAMSMISAATLLKDGRDYSTRVSVAAYCPTDDLAALLDGILGYCIDIKAMKKQKRMKGSPHEQWKRVHQEMARSNCWSLTGTMPTQNLLSRKSFVLWTTE